MTNQDLARTLDAVTNRMQVVAGLSEMAGLDAAIGEVIDTSLA